MPTRQQSTCSPLPLLLTSLLCLIATAAAPRLAIAQMASTSASSLYIENKGQIGDQHGRPNHEVRFLIARPGLNIQLRSNGFSYDSYGTTSTINFHRVDVDLVNANPKPLVTATGASQDYLNYYTHITQQVHGDKGATDVRGYATITYHDVWPGIDMEWFIDTAGRPEYQFVVRPGGNGASIQLQYRGANSTELVADALTLHVQHGPIRETLPRSYVLGTGVNVDVRYRAAGANTYGFTVPPIDIAMGETLVIDPMPQTSWGTYLGGDGRDGATSVATMADGIIVVAGQTRSISGVATAGSFRATLEPDNWDGFLGAFDAAGRQKWGTYFGGDAWDVATSIVIASNSEIVLTGWTDSQSGIATAGSHKSVNDGTRDGFLNRFASTGQRLWGTYVGGEGWDVANDVAITADGNLVVVGWTKSLQDVATQSSFQQQYGGNECDGFVTSFSHDGIRQWGTYFGGEGWDVANAVTTTPLGDIIVVGWTDSQTGIANTDGHQQTAGGMQDGFAARFLSDGRMRWGSYYGGTEEDQLLNVVATKSGDIVVVGQTKSTAGVATEGTHQSQPIGEANSAFIAALGRSGERLWGTYYGGEGEDLALSTSVTPTDEIVVVGCTQSWADIASDSSLQASYGGGNWDGFIATFSQAGLRTWGTYLGGDGADVIRSAVVTANGHLILAGESGSTANIATVGSHQSQLIGENDAFLAVVRLDQSTSVATETGNASADKIESLRPNPASGNVTVSVSTQNGGLLEIIDMLGKVVSTQPLAVGLVETAVSIGHLPQGRYVVRLVPTGSSRGLSTQGLVIVP